MFRWRTPGGLEETPPPPLHSQTPRGELREAGNELFRPARRERRPQADIRAVLRVPHHAAAGDDLQLHPLEEGICAGHVPQRPQAHGADAHGGQGVLGSLGIGPGQSPGPQQHAAEVPCHHAAYVGDALPLEHVQHGLARRALGLPVVGVADHAALLQQIAPAVVAGVVVALLHLLDALPGLCLGLHPPDVADEAGSLLRERALPVFKGHPIGGHGRPPCLLRAHFHTSRRSVRPAR